MTYETLSRAGLLFTETTLAAPAMLSANFGAGYRATSVLNGGLPEPRTWNMKIDVLPDNFDYLGQDNRSAIVALELEDASPLELETGVHILLGGIEDEPGPDPLIDTGETRAFYLWNLYLRSKQAGDHPFWLPVEGVEPGLKNGQARKYLVEFVDPQLTYSILCARIYSTGVLLRERRVRGVTSPI